MPKRVQLERSKGWKMPANAVKVCWCPSNRPCHAELLLAIANSPKA